MINNLNVNNLLYIYENEISKNVKNKRKLYSFEVNKMQYINNIITMLKKGEVGHGNYNIFLIYEPKCRLVMSLSIKDKIINHFITRYILEPKLTKYLCDRNVATRKNMGTDYAIKSLIKYINDLKNKHNTFYILKIDISKYFYSIDHDILKNMLYNKLDLYEYNLISKVIDSTNKEYVNKIIDKVDKNNSIPRYINNKGLPIGNMTSQFLSIYYLNKLDHYIIHNLKLKYFVRYMDDFIILESNLDKLKKAKTIIIEKLDKEYKLNINSKKTYITNIKNGFSFLGYTYKVINKKTIVSIKRSNLIKMKKKIKKLKHLFIKRKINHFKSFCSITTYSNSYKYSNKLKIYNLIDKYWYNDN